MNFFTILNTIQTDSYCLRFDLFDFKTFMFYTTCK